MDEQKRQGNIAYLARKGIKLKKKKIWEKEGEKS